MRNSAALPKTISHYTNISGLMGIVQTRRLWASNASFLNDRAELLHALDAAQTAIEKLTATKAMRHWGPTLERVISEMKNGKIPDTFVTCFCRDDDNLSQWRGYGGLEQGVSITFDRASLCERLDKQGASLYKVIYAKITTESKLREALKGELSQIANLEEMRGKNNNDRYTEIFYRVSSLLPKFKHLGFKDEREWRFVLQKSTSIDEVDFRHDRNRIVPYVALGQTEVPLPIVSIRVGPGVDQALTAQSLRHFLEAWGHEDAAINISEIPFRP